MSDTDIEFLEFLSYDDVLLVPKYSSILSRKDISIATRLDDDIKLDVPIIASPMDTVCEAPMAIAMANAGSMGILHRYGSPRQQEDMAHSVMSAVGHGKAGAAVGVTGDFMERTERLVDNGVVLICIDVAHGHHILMERAIKAIRDVYGDLVHIMAGNVATLDGLDALSAWGADSVRVGIGGGSICSTRVQTGHGVPNISSLLACSETERDVKIIADGGIRNSGDIVKALAAGADAVMVGSLLSGTDQTPGPIMTTPAGKVKCYRGMASREAQAEWRGKVSSLEGVSTYVNYKGDVSNILADLVAWVKSGFSYSGASSLYELWMSAEFVRQTTAGRVESSTHILG